MALRLNQSILKGEVDNRTPGLVSGKIWLVDRPEPVNLALTGNCHEDLAGCKLTFRNPQPQAGEHTGLDELQRGQAGDMTASRKVRVINMAEFKVTHKLPEPPTFANAVYLEWYSETNGRVVIESTDYELTVSDHEWTMPELPAHPPTEIELDEFQWESFMRHSDEIANRYAQAMKRYGQHPDRDHLVAREMGWNPESDEAILPLWDAQGPEFNATCPLIPNPATEGKDWLQTADGEIHHPLTVRCHAFAFRLWQYFNSLGSNDLDAELQRVVDAVDLFSAKVAGALDYMAFDDKPDYGFMIAYLKRALAYLHDAMALIERAETKRLIPEMVATFRDEMFSLRQQLIELMQNFRKQAQ